MEKLCDHQFWISGDKNIHANCGTKVYGDDQGNRYCTDKNCTGSHPNFGIMPMVDLVTVEDYRTKFLFIPTKYINMEKFEKAGLIENIKTN